MQGLENSPLLICQAFVFAKIWKFHYTDPLELKVLAIKVFRVTMMPRYAVFWQITIMSIYAFIICECI